MFSHTRERLEIADRSTYYYYAIVGFAAFDDLASSREFICHLNISSSTPRTGFPFDCKTQ